MARNDDRFQVVFKEGFQLKDEGFRQIMVDTQTGVNYLVEIGICRRDHAAAGSGRKTDRYEDRVTDTGEQQSAVKFGFSGG